MSNRTTDLTLLCVAVVWGSSYLATKEIASPDTVFALLSLRFGLAAAVLALLLNRRLSGLGRTELNSGVLGGVVLAAICICETYGVTRTSASNAGLIMALSIVATPVLQRFWGSAAIPPRFYVAGALAVLGAALLTQSGGFTVPGIGDTVVALAAVLRALHVTAMGRLSDGNAIDPARTTLVQLATVATISLLLSGASGQSVSSFTMTMSLTGWLLIGYLAVACTVFAFLAQLRALRMSSPARVSLLLGTEPLWAAVIGVAVARDPVTAAGIAGAVLVVMGTGWGRRLLAAPRPQPPRRPTRTNCRCECEL